MDDIAFDRALVTAAFTLAAERGWSEVSVTRAARAAGLPLDRARGRFLGVGGILARFGRIADQTALAQTATDGTPRDRLFDLLMRRFDVLQTHRGGVLALRQYLPGQPATALMLAAAHGVSMAFMLEAAGIPANGLRGRLRVKGLVAIWLRAARAWERDDSPDLAATMAALDAALERAVKLERWLRWDRDGDTDIAADASASDATAAEASADDVAEIAPDVDITPPESPEPPPSPPV